MSATPKRAEAREDWADTGVTWLRPGALFTAVTIRAGLVHGAIGASSPQECAQGLAGALDGPVFYRTGEFGPEAGYTVLLPASAGRIWPVPGTVVLPSRALLLVPAPDRCEEVPDAPWWVVPLDGPGVLCTPALLASLLSRGAVPAIGEEAPDA